MCFQVLISIIQYELLVFQVLMLIIIPHNNFLEMQNSRFLQFVSKMSRGELIIDDNQVKPAAGDWASEFQQQHNTGPSWANEYVSHDL